MSDFAASRDLRPAYEPVYEDVGVRQESSWKSESPEQSRREQITQKWICEGCGDVYWSDWYNHPPTEKDQLGGIPAVSCRR